MPYISLICPDAPLRSIGTNFWVTCSEAVRIVDVINRNWLRGFDSVRGRSYTIPIGLRCRRYGRPPVILVSLTIKSFVGRPMPILCVTYFLTSVA